MLGATLIGRESPAIFRPANWVPAVERVWRLPLNLILGHHGDRRELIRAPRTGTLIRLAFSILAVVRAMCRCRGAARSRGHRRCRAQGRADIDASMLLVLVTPPVPSQPIETSAALPILFWMTLPTLALAAAA